MAYYTQAYYHSQMGILYTNPVINHKWADCTKALSSLMNGHIKHQPHHQSWHNIHGPCQQSWNTIHRPCHQTWMGMLYTGSYINTV